MKFHERFDIEVGLEDARRRFVNRVYNDIILGVVYRVRIDEDRYAICKAIASVLGDKYQHNEPPDAVIGQDFFRNLQAIEGIFKCLSALELLDK